ncbi:hypothetical protein ASE99_22285 [Serratia sp. Leaf51]|nr:hypothetical protein ASE99_22285 [Serratia sp. Leaf51]
MKTNKPNVTGIAFLVATSLGVSFMATAEVMTGSAGIVAGTAPVIYNNKDLPETINITRDNDIIGDNDELEINDSISLSWRFNDDEGDDDVTLPSVEWICLDAANNKRTLSQGTTNYVIRPADKGCVIGVNITPKTVTGFPQANTPLQISDISSYDNSDNIPDGPVNPHAINIVGYIVAPNNPSARLTVSGDNSLHTAFAGAEVQMETDNLADQLDWTTSNSAIATVSNSGLVTFKTKGAVRIMARHNEKRASIIFSPERFYTASTSSKNWPDAKKACENQGLRLPKLDELSAGQHVRHAPGTSLWEEWGESVEDMPHSGVVFWSSDISSFDVSAYAYAYLSDGHISSNTQDIVEGYACVE